MPTMNSRRIFLCYGASGAYRRFRGSSCSCCAPPSDTVLLFILPGKIKTLHTAISSLSLAVLFSRIAIAALEDSARWAYLECNAFLAVVWAYSAAA